MTKPSYVHGYAPEEQARLIAQAEYWRDSLILPDLGYHAGERLLEIGCAAGASLGVIAQAFPGLSVSGIDLEEKQITFARERLAGLGVMDADLRVGDVTQLPFDDATFDHVFGMWILEHLPDAHAPLREALRVLKPGGSITLIETEYTSFRTVPESDDYELLRRAHQDLFAACGGNPLVARQLGPLLAGTGFRDVSSASPGFHFFEGARTGDLRAHVDYVHAFLAPMLDEMTEVLGLNRARLERGLEFLRTLPEKPEASFTQIVFRARGFRPAPSP